MATQLTPETLHRLRTVLIETRKRDGTWVATPVSVVVDADGRMYFRTYDASGKYKRLRNFSQLRVSPASTVRGRPIGPPHDGVAHQVTGDSEVRARKLLAQKYPLLQGRIVPWLHRRRGWTTVHYELTLDG